MISVSGDSGKVPVMKGVGELGDGTFWIFPQIENYTIECATKLGGSFLSAVDGISGVSPDKEHGKTASPGKEKHLFSAENNTEKTHIYTADDMYTAGAIGFIAGALLYLIIIFTQRQG